MLAFKHLLLTIITYGIVNCVPNTAEASEEHPRIKKSPTTTTFCVEIRPSNPDQRPFQVCEPPESIGPYPPAVATGVVPKPIEKPYPPAAVPAATYIAPQQPKPLAPPIQVYPAHQQHATYRSDDVGDEEDDQNELNTMHNSHGLIADPLMRSAGYGLEYGSPIGYIGVQPGYKDKYLKKGHAHNGVVITCQPTLAGYAATIPQSYGGYGGGYGGGYRSVDSSSNAGRSAFPHYKYPPPPPPPMYGGYAPQPYGDYKPPIHHYGPPIPSYLPPPPIYKPAYKPLVKPPIYGHLPHQGYAPLPPPIPTYGIPSYHSAIPVKPYGIPAHIPAYVPPPTYRQASDDKHHSATTDNDGTVIANTLSNKEKEAHTVQKMAEIEGARTSNGWASSAKSNPADPQNSSSINDGTNTSNNQKVSGNGNGGLKQLPVNNHNNDAKPITQ